MFSLISFHLNQTLIVFPTQWLLYSLCFGLFFAILRTGLPTLPIWKTLVLTAVPIAASLPGGRLLYHLVVERKFSFEDAGQAYYGALVFQTLAFWALCRILLAASQRLRALDVFAIASAFVYALLRLNCFANGCCYGKLCPHPWAVVFKDEDALTPLLGLPLHPTQLYSVMHGLIAGVILVMLFRRGAKDGLQGRLLWPFLALMGLGRFIIEPFRADLAPTLWHGVGLNQWLSLFMIASRC